MQQEKNTEILLETGTNEFEVMEFMIAGQNYGINVAKLCETCGIPWDYGVHKVGFFAIYMMGEI